MPLDQMNTFLSNQSFAVPGGATVAVAELNGGGGCGGPGDGSFGGGGGGGGAFHKVDIPQPLPSMLVMTIGQGGDPAGSKNGQATRISAGAWFSEAAGGLGSTDGFGGSGGQGDKWGGVGAIGPTAGADIGKGGGGGGGAREVANGGNGSGIYGSGLGGGNGATDTAVAADGDANTGGGGGGASKTPWGQAAGKGGSGKIRVHFTGP